MRVLTTLVLALTATASIAQSTWVPTHTRQDGTVVQGHSRSAPDSNRYNNYGWRDNDRDGTINSMDRQPNSRKGW